jgi:hypothetical protein
MSLSTLGVLVAIGEFVAVYVACVTHPHDQHGGARPPRDQTSVGH